MAPAASGMGCTTLTATLARFYQNRGEGVLIFDDREDGLLRLHFEAGAATSIPIMNRESASTLSITWFQDPMLRHQLDYRWFLMDTKSVTPALVNAQLFPGSCYLVPVLADMRGVKAAVRLSEQLDSYETEQGRRLPFYFVLNQFDRASRLQEEMRQHLMRRLGGRLAPVSVRWSEEVGAALAEGTTVLDYAPESPASQDFESLGEWLAGLGLTGFGLGPHRFRQFPASRNALRQNDERIDEEVRARAADQITDLAVHPRALPAGECCGSNGKTRRSSA